MIKFIVTLGLLYPLLTTYSQYSNYRVVPVKSKPPIDTSVLNKWPMAISAAISNNGTYAYYLINNGSFNLTLTFRKLTSSWQLECPGVYSAKFTEDSKKAIFINAKDSLCILTLGTFKMESIPNVSTFELFSTGDRILYQLKNSAQKLVIRELATGQQQFYDGVMEYVSTASGDVIVLKTSSSSDGQVRQLLDWVDVKTGSRKRIWEGNSASNLVLDESGTQLAFTVEEKTSNSSGKSCWYYQAGTQHAELLADQRTKGINPGLQLAGIQRFAKHGRGIIVKLQKPAEPLGASESVKVDVWSYRDVKLQSEQLLEHTQRDYTAIFDRRTSRVLQLQQDNEEIFLLANDDYAVIQKRIGEISEYWNKAVQVSCFVVSTHTGKKVQLPMMSAVPFASPR